MKMVFHIKIVAKCQVLEPIPGHSCWPQIDLTIHMGSFTFQWAVHCLYKII